MITPRTLHPNRFKTIVLLLVCLGFTAVGLFIWRADSDLIGLLIGGFFGLCTLAFVVMLLPGASYLKLSAEGFEVCSLFRKYFTRWDDVHEFGTIRQGALTFVAYNMRPDYSERHKLRGFTRAIGGGFECRIPDTYGMDATELAQMMHTIKWSTSPT